MQSLGKSLSPRAAIWCGSELIPSALSKCPKKSSFAILGHGSKYFSRLLYITFFFSYLGYDYFFNEYCIPRSHPVHVMSITTVIFLWDSVPGPKEPRATLPGRWQDKLQLGQSLITQQILKLVRFYLPHFFNTTMYHHFWSKFFLLFKG